MRNLLRGMGAVAVIALAAVSLAAPSVAAPNSQAAPRLPLLGRFIITLDSSVTDVGAVARQQLGGAGALDQVLGAALHGYSANLTQAALSLLSGDGRVVGIEREQAIHSSWIQPNPPVGLDRIDQRSLPLDRRFGYVSTGAGVTAYIVDSGVRMTHQDFQGRVLSGADYVDGGPADDCQGHGTHVAGILGSATFGVAKLVSMISVRVLDCNGSGSNTRAIQGINWIIQHHQAGQPAVANLSFGGGGSTAMDTAVRNLIADGVSVVVAAGNSNADACAESPGRVSEALTIAASDQNDARASFSNRGPCVDLFAPGVGIVSTGISSPTATAVMNGTSMSTPHVAGAVARYLQFNRSASPAQVTQYIASSMSRGVITGTQRTCALLLFCQPATPNNHLLYVAP